MPVGMPVNRRVRGFTLLEMVIAVAILAIMVVMAVPAFTSVINGNRLTAQANEMVADIQSARMEAIKRNRPVTLCPTLDDATCSAAGNWGRRIITAPLVPGPGVQVVRASVAKEQLFLTGNVTSIVFRPDGMARTAAGQLLAASIDICKPTTQPLQNIRRVTITSGSRVATAAIEHSTPGECPP